MLLSLKLQYWDALLSGRRNCRFSMDNSSQVCLATGPYPLFVDTQIVQMEGKVALKFGSRSAFNRRESANSQLPKDQITWL